MECLKCTLSKAGVTFWVCLQQCSFSSHVSLILFNCLYGGWGHPSSLVPCNILSFQRAKLMYLYLEFSNEKLGFDWTSELCNNFSFCFVFVWDTPWSRMCSGVNWCCDLTVPGLRYELRLGLVISEVLFKVDESMISIFQTGSKAPMQRILQLRALAMTCTVQSGCRREGLCLMQSVALTFSNPS